MHGTIASFLHYGLTIVLQVLLAPLVLKHAGQEVLGAYSIVMQIVGYGILLDLGFSVAMSRYLAQSAGFDDPRSRFTEIFTIGRVFLLVTNLVFAALIFMLAWQIDNLIVASPQLVIQARLALSLLGAWTIVRTPLALYSNGLNATQNMAAASSIGIIGNVVRLTLSLGLVYAGMGLIGLVAASIVSEFLTFAAQMRYFRRKYPSYRFGWRITNNELFREMFSFGMKYWGVNLALVLFMGTDSIIVGNLYSASAASVFYTTKIPAFLLMQFAFKLSDNAGPATNELFAQGNYPALQSAYLKVLRYSLLIALPLAVGIVGFNREVITAWVGGAQYAGDLMSFALAAFIVTQVINHINAMITLAAGDMRRWTTVSIATSVTSLALSYLLGREFGLQWVMVAIALMDLPNTVFLFKRSLSGLKLSFARGWREAFMPAILACLPLCLLVLCLKLDGRMPTVTTLVLNISIFIVLFSTFTWFVGLSRLEKELLKDKLRIRLCLT